MKSRSKIKVALLQTALNDLSKGERLARVVQLLQGLRGRELDLILLPELWNVGYFAFDDYEKGAEPLDGPTLTELAQQARDLKSYILAGSILERSSGRFFNTSALLDREGQRIAVYRKIHLFSYRSREREILTPGEEPVTAATELGRLGLSICYDLRFPELYRAELDQGAEIFLVPAAWPAARIAHWELLARARALENQCFLLGCNAAGVERNVQLGGRSLVVDPQGEILARAGADEEIPFAELDLEQVAKARAEFPALQDRILKTHCRG